MFFTYQKYIKGILKHFLMQKTRKIQKKAKIQNKSYQIIK